MNTSRRVVAELASTLYAGRLSYDEFIGALPADCEGDEEVSQLVDLITHEPKPGGLFSISATDYDAYIADIRRRIEALKKAEPNQPPQRNAGSRPFPGDSSASETPSSLGPRG